MLLPWVRDVRVIPHQSWPIAPTIYRTIERHAAQQVGPHLVWKRWKSCTHRSTAPVTSNSGLPASCGPVEHAPAPLARYASRWQAVGPLSRARRAATAGLQRVPGRGRHQAFPSKGLAVRLVGRESTRCIPLYLRMQKNQPELCQSRRHLTALASWRPVLDRFHPLWSAAARNTSHSRTACGVVTAAAASNGYQSLRTPHTGGPFQASIEFRIRTEEMNIKI